MSVLDADKEESNFGDEDGNCEQEPESFAGVVWVSLHGCIFVLANRDLVGGVVEGGEVLAEEWVAEDYHIGIHV